MNAKSGILMGLMILISTSGYAQNSDIESLRGLTGIYVLVENLQSEIIADGLNEEQIQTDVELKLRLAGIKVLTREEFLKESGHPHLYIIVNSIKNKTGLYSYSIIVSLDQSIYLQRNPEIDIFGATTWRSKYNISTVGEFYIDTSVRDAIKDRIDIFINDYLSVNPR
ncbi:hypothetical protein ACFL55_00395 [Candidatus Latescibacterota bacterium]